MAEHLGRYQYLGSDTNEHKVHYYIDQNKENLIFDVCGSDCKNAYAVDPSAVDRAHRVPGKHCL